MKKILRLLISSTMLLILSQGVLTSNAFGQFAPPPPPPEVNGSGGNRGPMDEGAPLGEGAWILITLVVGYGIHTYKVRKKTQETDSEL